MKTEPSPRGIPGSNFRNTVTAGLTLLAFCAGHNCALAAEPMAAHDTVVIVLDASGSMKGTFSGTRLTKMDAAKSALKEALRTLPASTHVGLLVFSASNLTNDWAYPLGPRNDAELMRAIELPEPATGTPLGAYIKKGADRLLQERAQQFGYGTYRLLVVTDGEAGDANLVERYTPEVISRGITLDVIGVGMKKSHTLATRVHSYRAANDAAGLKRALQEVFAEVATSGGDLAQEDVFAAIAPIPAELAAAMIQALSTPDNRLIGEKAPRPRPSAKRTAAPAQPAPAPMASSPAPAAPPPAAPRSGRQRLLLAWVVIGVVVIAVVSRLVKGSKR